MGKYGEILVAGKEAGKPGKRREEAASRNWSGHLHLPRLPAATLPAALLHNSAASDDQLLDSFSTLTITGVYTIADPQPAGDC